MSNLPSQLAVAGALGLALAGACIWFSPVWTFIALASLLFGFATLKRPEVALLGILVATSSIIFENKLPLISIGIGSLHIPDFLLLGSLGLVAVRRLVKSDFKIVRTPLDLPLLIFYGAALSSSLIAVFQSSVEVEAARRGIRVVSYYLTFFIVTNLLRERRQLDLLLNCFFLLGTIIATVMFAQYLLGPSMPLLPGRVEPLRTQDVSYEEVTRILPPGLSIVLVSFATIFSILVLESIRPLGSIKFIQWGLLGMAVLISFLRSYWAALIGVFFLLALIVRGRDRQRLVGWGLVAFLLSVILLLPAIAEPNSAVGRLVGASFSRLSTLWNAETLNEGSLQWRYVENEYALRQITAHPLLGLGLGALYRPFDPRIDYAGMAWDARGYLHNGHLWIMLDTGLLGYLALMWLSLAFLSRGFRHWRTIANYRMRGVVLGFTLIYLAILVAAVFNSTFMRWPWTPVIGIMMGVNEVIIRKFGQETSVI